MTNLLTSQGLISSLKQFKKSDGWLAAIAVTIAIIHLTMSWRVGALSYAGLSFLFWCAVASLVWDKRQTLNLNSGLFATVFAIALLIPLLVKSIFLITMSTSSLYIFPAIASFCIALLASGFKGLFQYRREILILWILGITQPFINIINNFDLSFLTAKFSTVILWYSGFNIVRDGTDIHFAGSKTGVEVYPGCSGADAIVHLLSLSLLFFLLFPSNLKTKILLPLAAVGIGFIANGIRVSLLSVIVAYHNNNGFEYWHSGEGSLLFSMVSSALLCGVAFILIQTSLNPERSMKTKEESETWP